MTDTSSNSTLLSMNKGDSSRSDAPAWAVPGNGRDNGAPEGMGPAELAKLLQEEPEPPVTMPARLAPARLLRGIWLRRNVAILTALVFLALSLVAALTVITPQWQAVTTLILRQDVEELSVGGGKPYQPPEYNIQTMLDTLLLKSSLNQTRELSGVEVELTTLAAAIAVSKGKESEVINLRLTWDDPTVAAVLVNNLASTFIQKTRAIRTEQAEADYQRYTSQLVDATERVRAADAKVLAFQRLYDVSDTGEEIKARLIDLSRLESEYATHQATIEAIRGARSELEKAIGAEPETMVASQLYRNPLMRKLEEYQTELEQLKSRYTATNPKVVKLQREVDALNEVIRQFGADSAPESTVGANQLRQDMRLMLHEVNDRLRVAEGTGAGLARSVKEMREKLAYLNDRDKELMILKAEQDSARALESSLMAKAQEARVAANTSEAPFSVVERAVPPDRPLSSSRRILVAAGLILGMGLGVFLALALEILDPKIRDHLELADMAKVQVSLELPVTGHPLIDQEHPSSPLARAFRRFINNLANASDFDAVAIISPHSDHGRAAVAYNMGASLAIKGTPALLVDGDVGKEKDHTAAPGLVDVVFGRASLEDCLQPTRIQGMQMLSKGLLTNPRTDVLCLGSPGIRAMHEELMRGPLKVIYELPPVDEDETALEFAAQVGKAVVVARSGETGRTGTALMLALLRSRNIEVIGAVVVDVPEERRAGSNPIRLSIDELKQRRSGRGDIEEEESA